MVLTREELGRFQKEAQSIVLEHAIDWLRVTMPDYKDGAASEGWSDAVKSLNEFVVRVSEATQ